MQHTIGQDGKREPEDTEELQEDLGPDEDGDWDALNHDMAHAPSAMVPGIRDELTEQLILPGIQGHGPYTAQIEKRPMQVRASGEIARSRELSQRPNVGDFLELRIGRYKIERVRGDNIVVTGKGGATGARLLPIAELERIDDSNVWRFKDGMERALAKYPSV